MKYWLAKAVVELKEAYEFLEEIAGLPTEEMVERVEERDPSFIEHIEAMEEPPKSTSELWEGFSIWAITGLRSNSSLVSVRSLQGISCQGQAQSRDRANPERLWL